MGISNSRQIALNASELQDFADVANLQYQVVQHLYKLFRTISSLQQDDGVIDQQEFLSAFQIKSLDSSQIVFKCLDMNEDGVINFREFVTGLSTFLGQSHSVQIKFLFTVMDFDNSNEINEAKVNRVLSQMLENFENIHITKDQIAHMVEMEFDRIFDSKSSMFSPFNEVSKSQDNPINNHDDQIKQLQKQVDQTKQDIVQDSEQVNRQDKQVFSFCEQDEIDMSPVGKMTLTKKKFANNPGRSLNYQMFYQIMMQNNLLLQWLQIDKDLLKQAALNLNK